jgi:DNA-binding NarL/FixJ family response regulator
MNAEKIYARHLVQQGVRGFVCKQSGIKLLEIAIRSLLNGEIYLSADLKKSLFESTKAALKMASIKKSFKMSLAGHLPCQIIIQAISFFCTIALSDSL